MVSPESKPKLDMRSQMPEVTRYIDNARAKWGVDHVNGCIAKGMRGEAGFFYAFERGHVVGTPWPASEVVAKDIEFAVTVGCKSAVWMLGPAAC